MTHWADQMTWLNPPPSAIRQGQALAVTTGENTDFWRGTFYGFYHDNGHFLFRRASGDFTAELTFSGDYRALYDQAGLMVRADADHWVKAGIEFTDGSAHFSVVVTNGLSDWSQQALPRLDGPLTIRLTRHGEAIRVQYRDAGGRWIAARLAHFPPAPTLEIGPMCCSPTRGGFGARFERFDLGAPISRDLHG